MDNNQGDTAAVEILTQRIIDDPNELKKLFRSRIKIWRERALMTQQEMSSIFEIPKRTIGNWEDGSRDPAHWAEKLIIEKLMALTEKRYVERLNKDLGRLKSDENGNRPVGSWAVIIQHRYDEFVDLFPDMTTALTFAEQTKGDIIHSEKETIEVAYIACNKTEDGTLSPFYCDRNGTIYGDHDGFCV